MAHNSNMQPLAPPKDHDQPRQLHIQTVHWTIIRQNGEANFLSQIYRKTPLQHHFHGPHIILYFSVGKLTTFKIQKKTPLTLPYFLGQTMTIPGLLMDQFLMLIQHHFHGTYHFRQYFHLLRDNIVSNSKNIT